MQERALNEFMEAERKNRELADAASQFEGEGLEVPIDEGPGLPASVADKSVLERKLLLANQEMERVREEKETMERLLKVTSTLKLEPEDSNYAIVTQKIKIPAPAPWEGEVGYSKLESWIKSARGYLIGIGIEDSAILDEYHTPLPLHTVRMLFASKETNGLSPQAWFDSRLEKRAFSSVSQLFEQMRLYWKDDNAAEENHNRYLAARQGSMRAREFGRHLEVLADACFDRVIDDADRISTFKRGLNSTYRDYVLRQCASLEELDSAKFTFDRIINIAARGDGIPSISSSLVKTNSSSSSPSSNSSQNQKSNRTNSSSSSFSSSSVPTSSPSSPSPRRSPDSVQWIEAASKWQAEHPASTKATWFRSNSREAPPALRCFNCGEKAKHYSTSCPPERRTDPGKVIIAVISKLSSTSPSPLSLSSSKIEEEISDSESGKAGDE